MKIYFLHNGLISFVKKDFEILESAHKVRPVMNHGKAFRNLWKNISGVLWCDMLFCWFASIHFLPSVLFARLLRKKIVIVAGGYEVVNLPEINYGNMRGGIKTAGTRLLLHIADRVVSISKSNQREAIRNGLVDPSLSILIYHGFSPPEVIDLNKEPIVITIGAVSWSNLKRKGLEDFVRLASFFPEVPFKLIGKWSDDSHLYLEKISTPNVEIMGFADDATFDSILRRAKVYVQASTHEGFGCSVAEAMLYGCIPVVSNTFALPEVVGECGYLASVGNMEEFRHAVNCALNSDAASGETARSQIIKSFPLLNRKKQLLGAVANT